MTHYGWGAYLDDYVGSLTSLLIASGISFAVAMKELLRYVARRLLGIVAEMMLFVPPDTVTNICSVAFVSYYAGDVIILGELGWLLSVCCKSVAELFLAVLICVKIFWDRFGAVEARSIATVLSISICWMSAYAVPRWRHRLFQVSMVSPYCKSTVLNFQRFRKRLPLVFCLSMRTILLGVNVWTRRTIAS